MKRLAALAAFKLSLYLKPRVSDEFFKRYSRLISPDVTEEEVASYPEDAEELFFDKPIAAERWRFVQALCANDPIALTAVQLYFLALMDERTLDLLREGLGLADALTIEAAGRIAHRGDESIDLAPQLRAAYDRVELLLQADPDRDWWKAPFRLDGRLAAWLAGDDTPDRSLERICTISHPDDALPPCTLTTDSLRQTVAQLRALPGFSIVHISGEEGSGRRHFARHTAHILGRPLLLVPFDAVARDGLLRSVPWRRVLRELLLSDRLLCLSGPDHSIEKHLPQLLEQLDRDLSPFDRPIFLTTPTTVKVVPFLHAPVLSVSIPQPTILQSAQLWRELAGSLLPDGGSGFPAESIAAKMNLTVGQMERIIRLLSCRQPAGPWAERDIFKLCYQVLDDGRYENIRFVRSSYSWDDLQLEAPLKRALQAVCAQVEQQGTVLDKWGLRRRYPYGRCVSVLMSGPPGTGKTMTAQVLAARLGLELYKVDLSQIVDKYIGETEKRLRQVFDQAEKSNLILFFDEADALLGKRSEVKDAKDKYANTEVAYLLQRIEEYQGIVLMSTNQAGSIDAAFVRRFRYHLVFTLPDEPLRRAIWEDALRGIPSASLPLDYLSRQFQLSGAQIKNIVLNGAYCAAADGSTLHMEHLVRAIFQELQKDGKVLLAGDFGEYGVMLSELLSGG